MTTYDRPESFTGLTGVYAPKLTVRDRFKAQLDELAEYLELAEKRGDGVQIVLSADAGKAPKAPKVTAYPETLAQKRNRG